MSDYQQDLSDMASTMKGCDSLSGWDCLVAYSEDAINSLLSERASALGILDPLTWSAEYNGLQGQMTLSITLNLSNPVLQFVDTSTVTFSCPASGSYQITSETPLPDPVAFSGLQIVISTSLVNVAGVVSTDQGEWQPGSDQPSPSNWSVSLDPESDTTRAVCINFKNCTATVNWSGDPGLSAIIAQYIEDYFDDAVGLQYYIAALSNVYANDPGADALQPTSFCFTVIPGNTAESIPGTLCIWIGVKGGANNGTQPSGQTDLQFAPGGKSLTPLPSSNTASIIFSHDIMANLFLTPSLSQTLENVVCTSVKGQEGMTFSFTWPSFTINVPQITRQSIVDSSGGKDLFFMDGCSFNMDEPAATLAINPQQSSTDNAPFSVAYASDVQNMEWQTFDYYSGYEVGSGTSQNTFNLTGQGQWCGSSNASQYPNEIGFNLSFGDSLTCVCQSTTHAWWQQIMGGGNPPAYQSVKPQIQEASVSMRLDYFLTTNLLFPGAYIFMADNPVASDGDTDHGIATPRDTILTGQVNLDALASARQRSNIMIAAKNRSQNASLERSKMSLKPAPSTSTPPPGSIDAFKADILAIPAKPILGDLVRITSLTTDDAEQDLVTILASYGYGSLAPDDFLGLVGLTSAAILEGPTSSAINNAKTEKPKSTNMNHPSRRDSGVDVSEPQLNPIPADGPPLHTAFDLRMFGGFYLIQKPLDWAGRLLAVSPVAGTITYMGVTASPEQTVDQGNGQTTVTWSTGSQTFNVVFEALVNESYLFTAGFSGSCADASNNAGPVPLSGIMKQPASLPRSDQVIMRSSITPRFDQKNLGQWMPLSLGSNHQSGGQYTVTRPAQQVGQHLIVAANGRNITYCGVVAELTPMDSSGRSFRWSIDDKIYHVKFTRPRSGARFDGTVTTSGQSQTTVTEDFSGIMSIDHPAELPLAQGILIDDFTLAATIVGLVGVGITICQMIGCIAPFIWRRQDSHNNEHLARLIEANGHMMEEKFLDLEMNIQGIAMGVVEQTVQDHEVDLQKLEEPIQNELRTRLDQMLAEKSAVDVQGFQLQNINDPKWADLFTEARGIVQSRIAAELNELAGPKVDTMINVWKTKNFITPSDLDTIKARGLDSVTARQSGQLDEPVEGGPSYLSALISSRILNAGIQGRQTDLEALQQQLDNMAYEIQNTQQEQQAVADELARAQDEANDPARSPEDRAKAAELAAELQKEVDAKVAQAQKEIEKQQDLETKNQQMQDRQDESRTQLEDSERAAETARERAFDGD